MDQSNKGITFDYKKINFLSKSTLQILCLAISLFGSSIFATNSMIATYLEILSILTLALWPIYFIWKKRYEIRAARKVIITDEKIYFLLDNNIKLIKWSNIKHISKRNFKDICIEEKNGNKEYITNEINGFDMCFGELYEKAKKRNIKFSYL